MAEEIAQDSAWKAKLQAKMDACIPVIDHLAYMLFGRNAEAHESGALATGPIRIGLWVFILVFIVFGGWAAFAPLSSAAVAMGTVVLDANKKTIQHLEGGIVEEILVRDGDLVEAGQPLIRLSETAARARLDLVQAQYWSAIGREARLLAERDQLSDIAFPLELTELADNPTVKEILDSQTRIFATRGEALVGNAEVLERRVNQYQDEIKGLEAQMASAKEQLSLINEEVETVEKLVKSGNAAKPRLLALQRNAADLFGQIGEYQALIARAQQSIAQTEREQINLKTDWLNEVVDELRVTQDEIASLAEQRNAARDVVNRLDIVAPQAGIVTGLQVHTKGGVISPGQALLDIVPQDDLLVIEARVNIQDIDVVHQGLPARVRLTAFKMRTIPPVLGEVTSVSADRFVDEATGEPFYKARVTINETELAALENVDLYPGMPAEVLIVTGSRTMLSYLADPVTGSLFRAFREE